MADLAAYIRDPYFVTEVGSSGCKVIEAWRRSEDRNEIMQADHNDLIFVDDMEIDEVRQLFAAKYPTVHPSMQNLRLIKNGYVTQYCTQIFVYDEPWYAGNSEAEVAAIAQEMPSKTVRISDPFNNTHLPAYTAQRWDQTKAKYVECPDPLEEFDCYRRLGSCQVDGRTHDYLEVVYSPGVVKRRQTLRKRRASRKKKEKQPAARMLTVEDLNRVTLDINNHCHGAVRPSFTDFYSTNTRRGAIRNLAKILAVFWFAYGRTAHRHVPAFQRLMRLWRDEKHREATLKSWRSIPRSAGRTNDDYEAFFEWLDKEARQPIPKGDMPKPRVRVVQVPF